MGKSRVSVHQVAEVMEQIKDGSRIVTGMAAAEPEGFFQYLSGDFGKSRDLRWKIFCANPTQAYSCFAEQTEPSPFQLIVMFLTSVVRSYQVHSHVHYSPQHLSHWVQNILALGQPDVFWGVCTEPDERGFVSLGPGACYESEIRRRAKMVVLEINPQLPLTFGDTQVPVKEVDFFIERQRNLPLLTPACPQPIDHQIAGYIADLVPDGATIQLGIGNIPNAVGEALGQKKDLGIHTEMINDAMMDLSHKGVITGRRKTIWPGKIVGSFAYGSQELYRFLDKNPLVELQPSSVVNDPYRIGRNHHMISINTAIEVDITGQVCSESIGHQELSGVGGASETHVGAQRSANGRSTCRSHAH